MNPESTPLISVIVAVYNGEETLQQCINSFAQQTYPNKELIIIDGGSTDNTIDLLKGNNEEIAYWISEPDHGIYNAWNKGLAWSRGEWICFLGADDFFWDAQALAQMSAQLEKLPSSVRVAYGQILLLTTEDDVLYPIGDPWDKVKGRFKQVMSIPHQGVMHRRSLFEEYGEFDESFRIAGDYEFLLRELKTADAVFIPDINITAMRQGGISSDPANTLLLMWEFRRAQQMHGEGLPGWIWLTALAKVYIRLLLWRVLGEKLARKTLDIGRRMMGLPAFWTKVC